MNIVFDEELDQEFKDDFLATENLKKELTTTKTFNIVQHTEETRSKIANKFINGYFWFLGISVGISILFNIAVFVSALTNEAESINYDSFLFKIEIIIPIIASAIGSPMGFVLGYYFKSKEIESENRI